MSRPEIDAVHKAVMMQNLTELTQAIAQGEQAALAAIELLKGQPVGKRNCNLSLELVIRESCGAERTGRSREGRRLII